MSAGFDEITQMALTIPVEQRAQVANALLAGLDDPADSADVHQAWTAEITARVDDIVSGRVSTIPWDEVKAQLAADRMSRSASEYFEAGMSLPPSVRKDVAIRLLESLEIADQESVDTAWTAEITSRINDVLDGTVKTIPGEQVFADLAARRAARNA